MPRCHHGSFQDTGYGIHGNQYDISLVHFQLVLEKNGIFCLSHTERWKRETTMKAFFTYGLHYGRRKRPTFLRAKIICKVNIFRRAIITQCYPKVGRWTEKQKMLMIM